MTRCQCKRCGHVWVPRLRKFPKRCPHCKSILWHLSYEETYGNQRDCIFRLARRYWWAVHYRRLLIFWMWRALPQKRTRRSILCRSKESWTGGRSTKALIGILELRLTGSTRQFFKWINFLSTFPTTLCVGYWACNSDWATIRPILSTNRLDMERWSRCSWLAY